MDFLGEIPLEIAIRETSDAGRPIVASAPEGPLARAYLAIAERLVHKLAHDQPAAGAPRIVVS